MRKVTKILAKVLSILILLSIFLPVGVTLFLSIETVQNFVVSKAAKFATELLGAEVSIGRINIDLFSRVHVRDFYVEDYERDTLLYVNDVRARLIGFNTAESGLRIHNAQLNGGKFCLREMESGELNVRPIVQKMTKQGGSKSDFKLFIDNIEAEGVEFCYERLNPLNPEYGMDYYHMHIYDIATDIENFSVVKGRVDGSISNLSARERSGLLLDDLSCFVYIDRGLIGFEKMKVATPNSMISIPSITLDGGGDWATYKDYINRVRMTGVVEDTVVSTDDIAYFAPAMREWKTELVAVNATFEGVVSDFEGVLQSAKLGERSSVAADFHIKGLPDWRNTHYGVKLEDVRLYSTDVIPVVTNVVNKPLPRNVMDIIKRVTWLNMNATFDGKLSAFKVNANMRSSAGDVKADVAISRKREGYAIKGDVVTDNLGVGHLLNQKNIHTLDTRATADVLVGKAGIVGSAQANIESIGIGANRYSGIGVTATIDGSEYSVSVASEDNNLGFSLDDHSYIKLSDEEFACNLLFRDVRADLHALGINKRDTLSMLSADQIFVEAQGATIEQMSGVLSLSGVRYIYPAEELKTDLINATVEDIDGNKSILLDTEFFDMAYMSDLDYKQSIDFILKTLKTYVPIMYDANVEYDVPTRGSGISMALLTDARDDRVEALLRAINPKLIIAPNTRADFTYVADTEKLSLRLNSEVLEYAGVMMENAAIDINNINRDSLAIQVRSSSISSGSTPLMTNFSIRGGTCRNRLGLRATFQDSVEHREGNLDLNALFGRDRVTGRSSIRVNNLTSTYTTRQQRWEAMSRGIDIDSSRISIHDLHLTGVDVNTGGGVQRLTVDGVMSRSRNDSIRLNLDNFDLSPLSALVKRWGYDFRARSNGYVSVKSALKGQAVDAQIRLDSIAVNGARTNSQLISSKWDFVRDRAYVLVSDTKRQDTVIRGYYQPTGKRYLANAKIDGVPMSLISPFLTGIISDIEGTADVDVSIEGAGRQAKLSGGATVDSLGATVDYLQTRYTAPRGSVKVENNHIIADKIPVFDVEGHEGHFSMDLSLEKIDNVTYDIDIGVKDMLVMDINENENDYFYGHVYASGDAHFKGDKLSMKMDIEATSGNNSTFYMPLSGKENASYADFVRFKEPEKEKSDSSYIAQRRKANERQRRTTSDISSILDIEMNMNVQPNTEIQLVFDPTVGDAIKARGSGQLTLHMVPKTGTMEMSGLYTITEGTYLFTLQNIINKKFVVEPGSSILWSGDPLDAVLNINAIYNTKASLKPLIGNSLRGVDMSRTVPVECYIILTDNLMSPTVTFDIKVPNAAPEIQTVIQSALNDQQAIATQMFWLLAAGTFSAEDTGAMGATISATTGFELLSNQLSNWLSGDNYNVTLRYRPRTELSGDEVDLGVSTSLWDDRLIIELEGGYLSDASAQATENASNFVGEAFITWLIDPDGSLRFRGFTQTIDRYGENQGMQEAGMGLYYSESFNTFKDLGQSLKRHFVTPEMEAEQMQRRQKREERRLKNNGAESADEVDVEGVQELLEDAVIE